MSARPGTTRHYSRDGLRKKVRRLCHTMLQTVTVQWWIKKKIHELLFSLWTVESRHIHLEQYYYLLWTMILYKSSGLHFNKRAGMIWTIIVLVSRARLVYFTVHIMPTRLESPLGLFFMGRAGHLPPLIFVECFKRCYYYYNNLNNRLPKLNF